MDTPLGGLDTIWILDIQVEILELALIMQLEAFSIV